MARKYLDVEAMDDATLTVRCPVVEWDARALCPDPRLFVSDAIPPVPRSLVVRPDTGELMLVFQPRDNPRGRAMISAHDPAEARHERDWPALAERLTRHTNRSK